MAETSRTPVSIVTVLYNRAEYVGASLQSLLDQTHADLEIIAVDDGSTDGTLAQLEAIRDPRLRVIAKENSGFTTSLIAAVAQSQGTYVALNGAGDLSYPDRIARQAAFLDGRPDIGVVGCWVRKERTDGPGSVRKTRREAPLAVQPLRQCPFTHGEVMFRRAVYDAVGGYRPYFKFAQDLDLWLRMGRLTDFEIVPEILYLQKIFPGTVSATPDKLMMQSYLGEFARQCAENRDASGRDWLDRHGPQGAVYRRPSKRLARFLAARGVDWMRGRNVAAGWQFLEQSWSEYPLLSTRLKMMVCGLHRSPFVWKNVVAPVLRQYGNLHAAP